MCARVAENVARNRYAGSLTFLRLRSPPWSSLSRARARPLSLSLSLSSTRPLSRYLAPSARALSLSLAHSLSLAPSLSLPLARSLSLAPSRSLPLARSLSLAPSLSLPRFLPLARALARTLLARWPSLAQSLTDCGAETLRSSHHHCIHHIVIAFSTSSYRGGGSERKDRGGGRERSEKDTKIQRYKDPRQGSARAETRKELSNEPHVRKTLARTRAPMRHSCTRTQRTQRSRRRKGHKHRHRHRHRQKHTRKVKNESLCAVSRAKKSNALTEKKMKCSHRNTDRYRYRHIDRLRQKRPTTETKETYYRDKR